MAFKYRGRDASDVKQRATQKGGTYDSYVDCPFPKFKVSDGDNDIRIIPPPPDIDVEKWGKNWAIEVYLHMGIGADRGSYLCPKKMLGKPCHICDSIMELDSEKDEELIRTLKPKKRALCYLIDRGDEKQGPCWWDMPWTVERDISACSIHKKTGEVLMIDHPDEGYDVSFFKEGKERLTRYIRIEVAREESPLYENMKQQEKWLALTVATPITDILHYYDNEHLKAVYSGKISRATEEEEEEEPKPKRRSRVEEPEEDAVEEKPRRRRSEPEEDDAEEAPPKTKRRKAEPEDEEVEDKPSRSRRSREEPEEEPEEEDDPAPKTKRVERLRRAAEDEKPKRSRREEPEDEEEEEEPKPKRRSRVEEDLDDAIPEKPKRRAAKEEPEEEEDDVTSRAKARIEKLKKRQRDDD